MDTPKSVREATRMDPKAPIRVGTRMKRARASYLQHLSTMWSDPKACLCIAWPTKLPEGFQGTPAPPSRSIKARGLAVSFPAPSAHLLHGSAARSQIERASSSYQGCRMRKTKSNEQPPEILRFSNRGPACSRTGRMVTQFLWIQGLSHALTERDSGCSIHGADATEVRRQSDCSTMPGRISETGRRASPDTSPSRRCPDLEWHPDEWEPRIPVSTVFLQAQEIWHQAGIQVGLQRTTVLTSKRAGLVGARPKPTL